MAYEIKDNSFNFQWNSESINSKFPTLKFQMKLRGQLIELPIWVRDGSYGRSYGGNVSALVEFALAVFGKAPKKKEQEEDPHVEGGTKDNPTDVSHMREDKPQDRSSLIR